VENSPERKLSQFLLKTLKTLKEEKNLKRKKRREEQNFVTTTTLKITEKE